MPFLIVLGACVILLGLTCIVAIIRVKRGAQGIANWPKTPGTVTEAFVYTHERRTEQSTQLTYTPTVVYTYTVEGQAYTASKRTLEPYYEQSYTDKAQAQAVLAMYPVGRAVAVYYNPEAPQQAVLEKPKPLAHNAVIWYGVTHVLMGTGAIALAFLLS